MKNINVTTRTVSTLSVDGVSLPLEFKPSDGQEPIVHKINENVIENRRDQKLPNLEPVLKRQADEKNIGTMGITIKSLTPFKTEDEHDLDSDNDEHERD